MEEPPPKRTPKGAHFLSKRWPSWAKHSSGSPTTGRKHDDLLSDDAPPRCLLAPDAIARIAAEPVTVVRRLRSAVRGWPGSPVHHTSGRDQNRAEHPGHGTPGRRSVVAAC